MEPFATWRASTQTRHVRLGRRFVEEDEAGGIEAFLGLAPDAASAGDIGPGLFCGAESLFLYDSPMSAST